MKRLCRMGIVFVSAAIWMGFGIRAMAEAAKPEVKDVAPGGAPTVAPAAAEVKMASQESIRYGFDLRLRQEGFDDIPIKPGGVTRGGRNNYFRIRPRVWGEVDLLENVTFRARVVNEFREWNDPDMSAALQRSSSDFPDEYVFDHLYVEAKDLLDKKLDIRIGRQDLIYGTGKIVLEGTPKDGSRTIYFNAAKAVWKGMEDTTIDLVGICNPSIDDLAINDADRDLTGQTKNNDDITESGAIVYLKNKSMKALPFELYGIYKNESEWTQKPTATTSVDVAALDVGTAGFRLMPVFGSGLSGNLEVAYQMGSRGDVDTSGLMVDALAAYQIPGFDKAKPTVDAGVYYLSGDDPSTTDNEGWNPLWARYPQYSDLYVFAWDAEGPARWSNLMMPKASFTVSPCKCVKATAMVGALLANEDDGPGTGKDRGMLYLAKGEFNLGGGYLAKQDKVTGHLLLEIFEPGNYYTVTDTAYFARWEVIYSF